MGPPEDAGLFAVVEQAVDRGRYSGDSHGRRDAAGPGMGGFLRAKVIAGAALMCTLVGGLSSRAEARVLDGCRPLRAIFYASTGSLTLAQGLAANTSVCAQYYVSVPPLTADKTQMRSGVAGPIR